MLKIFFGPMNGAEKNPPAYFDKHYQDAWITDPLSVEIIDDVDQMAVIRANYIESSSHGGPTTPLGLSRSVKTLLLLAHDETGKVFSVSACGDRSAKWILKIAETKDLTINMRHPMDFGDDDFEALVLNDNRLIHNAADLIEAEDDFNLK